MIEFEKSLKQLFKKYVDINDMLAIRKLEIIIEDDKFPEIKFEGQMNLSDAKIRENVK